jgi:hypothetical protein
MLNTIKLETAFQKLVWTPDKRSEKITEILLKRFFG